MEKEKTVEFDKTTFRVTECPRCHNKDFSIDAEYCKICGLRPGEPLRTRTNWGGLQRTRVCSTTCKPP
jgi:ribosomal protein L37E